MAAMKHLWTSSGDVWTSSEIMKSALTIHARHHFCLWAAKVEICWKCEENREFKKWRRQRQRQRQRYKSIWLVGWGKIIALHVRHTLYCIFLTYSAKRRHKHVMFGVLTTTRDRSSKSFILCLYLKANRAKKAIVHFAYLVQRDYHGIIAKHVT